MPLCGSHSPLRKAASRHCRHLCDLQMCYVLKGWVRFIYEGQQGELIFRPGDCVLQPVGIVHNEIA